MPETSQIVRLSRESLAALAEALKDKSERDLLNAEYISVARAAKRIDASTDTIRRLIEKGQLPAYRFGTSIRIKIRDLDRAAKPVTPSAEPLAGDRA